MSSKTTTKRRTARLGVQALEAREVPTIFNPPVLPPLTPPDGAGGTMEAARTITLPTMRSQAVSDYLPSAADVDVYKVTLHQGDFLATDLHASGAVDPAATIQLLNAAGTQIGTSNSPRIGPGLFRGDPTVGAYAPADGTYYVRVTTDATTTNSGRGYNLNLERVALDDSNMAAAPLATGGAYHAWLNATGDTLNVTGPTGYGFSLRGGWVKTVSGSAVTYTARGTLYLRTPVLAQTAGEIALQVAAGQTFKVTTHAAGLAQLGELTGVSGHFGLSLAPVADQVKQMFGLDVSSIALADGWTIKTGAQIRHDYQSYVRHDIGQLLDGVPYLVYGQAGKVKMTFGGVTVTSDNQSKMVLIADPADPFLYVGYKQYAAAGSLNGHIPFHATVAPTDPMAPAHGGNEFYGQVYAAGTYPLAGLPFNVNGDVTVDLDANRDGQFLAGAGNASQLFHGDLRALDAVARDINVGVNGGVNLSYSVANHTITVPLGQASAFYSGPQQGVWFKGVQGTAFNPWAGTVLANFQAGPGTAIEGYAYRDGRFSVSTTSNYRLFTANAALTVTVTDHNISAEGTIETPVGDGHVAGSIGFDGNFHWVVPGYISIGTDKNHLRGDAALTIDRNGGTFTVAAELDAEAKLSIPGFKAEGKVTGTLKVTRSASGAVTYSADLDFDGGAYAWNPVTQKWNKLGSVDVGFSVSGNKLKLHALGHTFTLAVG